MIPMLPGTELRRLVLVVGLGLGLAGLACGESGETPGAPSPAPNTGGTSSGGASGTGGSLSSGGASTGGAGRESPLRACECPCETEEPYATADCAGGETVERYAAGESCEYTVYSIDWHPTNMLSDVVFDGDGELAGGVTGVETTRTCIDYRTIDRIPDECDGTRCVVCGELDGLPACD